MPLLLRQDKGTALTNAELDGNFIFLDDRVNTVAGDLADLSTHVDEQDALLQLNIDGKQPLNARLTSLSSLAALGLVTHIDEEAGTITARSIEAATSNIVVTNGNGVVGNPQIDIGTQVLTATSEHTISGKRISGNNNIFESVPITSLVGILPVSKGGTESSTKEGARATLEVLKTPAGNGIVVQIGTDTTVTRQLAVSGIGLSLSTPDGLAGNPTININSTSVNNPTTIVARDGSGNFSAGVITASLNGNALSATTVSNGVYTTGSYNNPTWITGLAGSKVTSIPNSSLINSGITLNGVAISLGATVTLTPVQLGGVSTNTASTLVLRDASGNFSAGTITANLIGNATNATTVTNGVYTTGAYNNPSWITGLAGSKVSAIPNSSLVNPFVTINGVTIALGQSVTYPFVYTTESYNNPTWITGLAGSKVTAIPNSSLVNSSLTVNGGVVSLGGSVNLTPAQLGGVSTNTPSTLVLRDESGNFAAGTITGSLVGNASTATLALAANQAAKLTTARTINGVAFDGTANITIADSTKVPLTGGTMTGYLTLNGDPVSALQAATKQYVDQRDNLILNSLNNFVLKAGDTMTGQLTMASAPIVLGVGGDERVRLNPQGSVANQPDIKFKNQALIASENTITIMTDSKGLGNGIFTVAKGQEKVDGSETSLFTIYNSGKLRAEVDASTYAGFINDPRDLPNKKYVDDLAANVVRTTSTYSNPSWLTSLAGSKVTAIPNSSLVNAFITINGNAVALGQSVTLPYVSTELTYNNPSWLTGLAGSKVTTIPNSSLVNSGITLNGVSISLGGTAILTPAQLGGDSANTPSTLALRDASGNFAANVITANTFVGSLTGNATTANQAATAAQANKLTTPRTINGVAFDGTANIQVFDNLRVLRAGDTMTGDLIMNNAVISLRNGGDERVRINNQGSVANQPDIQFKNHALIQSANSITIMTDGKGLGQGAFQVAKGAEKVDGSETGLFTIYNNGKMRAEVPAATYVGLLNDDRDIPNKKYVDDLVNSSVQGTSLNTPNTLVKRDSSGNFAAGTITANLIGNATSATTVTNGVYTTGSYNNPAWITGLAGSKVTAIPNSSLVNAFVTINGNNVPLGQSVNLPYISSELTYNNPSWLTGLAGSKVTAIPNTSLVNSSVTINGATVSLGGLTTLSPAQLGGVSANTPSTLVLRDSSGNFAAGLITADLVGNASSATVALSANQANKLTTPRTINGVAFDGTANITISDNTKVALAGSTMTGFLTLNADPVNPLHAATKQYVDSVVGGGDAGSIDAWVVFNGVNGGIIGAYNVTSVSIINDGKYQINIAPGVFTNGNFAVGGTASDIDHVLTWNNSSQTTLIVYTSDAHNDSNDTTSRTTGRVTVMMIGT